MLLQLFIEVPNTSTTTDPTKTKFLNPLYDEYQTIAKKNNLDLSFTKYTWIQRFELDFKKNPIFKEKKNSIDILFIGDSSIAWGLIPKVIEQLTGKKTAMVAYESNLLNKQTSKIYSLIADYYLKEDGILIYSFDSWTLSQHPTKPPKTIKGQLELSKYTVKEFEAFAKNFQKNFQKNFFHSYLSFESFNSLYKNFSTYLKLNLGLYLKSPNIYSNYIEPQLNPKFYAKKTENQDKNIKFLRWDDTTITQYNPAFTLKSIYSNAMPTKPLKNKFALKNANYSSNIKAKYKIYMVPIYSSHELYKLSRNIYYTYYKNKGYTLCDLGLLHPKDTSFTIQAYSHTGNEAGLQKTILIAKYINNFLVKNSN